MNPNPRQLSDLNAMRVTHAFDPASALPLLDYSTATADGLVQVFFRELESHLIEFIEHAEYVVGSVAWLTSFPVVRALKKARGVSIIVQKEGYLRSDYNGQNARFYFDLRREYYSLPSIPRRLLGGRMDQVQPWPYMTRDAEEAAIRKREIPDALFPIQCVGFEHTHSQRPLLHTKFLVFCRVGEGGERFEPYAVWTGSCNFSNNARKSLENAVVIRHPEVVAAFFQHYVQLAALSEPTEWDKPYPDPKLVADASSFIDRLMQEEEARAQQEYQKYEDELRAHEQRADKPDLEDDSHHYYPRRIRKRSQDLWDDWQQDERHWL